MEDSPKKSDFERARIVNASPDTEDYHNYISSHSSLYDKKSAILNTKIDEMGFGKYQVAIFFLCGFGYFLDLMWAQCFGLIVGPIAQEMNASATDISALFSGFSAGLTVGALFWGLSADTIGRKWAFNLTCLVTSVFGMLCAAPVNNFDAVCAMAALCGFGLGGNIPIDATITLEFLPQNRRWVLGLLSMFQPLGVTACTVIAYGLVPQYYCGAGVPACSTVAAGKQCCTVASNMGWRYQLITLGCITLGIFFLRFVVFNFQESPRYLLSRGRDEEAIKVVHYIAKYNGTTTDLDISTFRALESEVSQTSSDPILGIGQRQSLWQTTKRVSIQAWYKFRHLAIIFKTWRSAVTFGLLAIIYMGDFWSFNLAGSFLPLILARYGQSKAQSTRETYRQYIYIYTPGIIGSVLAAASMDIPKVGRKYSMVIASAMQGTAMILYVVIRTIPASIGFNALEYIAQTYFAALLYAYTPEAFPGPVRGSACGMLSTIGRLSGIVSPYAAAPYLNSINSNGVLYLAAGGAYLCTLVLPFLPIESKGRQTL